MSFKNLTILTALCALALGLGGATSAQARDRDCTHNNSSYCRQRRAVDEIITNVNLSNVAQQYTTYYAVNAQFNDPTITVNGRDAIIAHLQQSLQAVSVDNIVVDDVIETDGKWVATYEMYTHLMIPVNGVPTPVGQQIKLIAATVLEFDCHDKIKYHRDYYDQLAIYQQIPNFAATIQGLLFQYIGSLFGAP